MLLELKDQISTIDVYNVIINCTGIMQKDDMIELFCNPGSRMVYFTTIAKATRFYEDIRHGFVENNTHIFSINLEDYR